jgi:hypothetical protein
MSPRAWQAAVDDVKDEVVEIFFSGLSMQSRWLADVDCRFDESRIFICFYELAPRTDFFLPGSHVAAHGQSAHDFALILVEAIWMLLLSAAMKFVDLIDRKVEGSRPDDKIQSSQSPRSVPIDEG